MVSAWANEHQLVLGQLAVEEKSNEITAVPQLLDMLDVAGGVVTADAMSCQKEIVKKISSEVDWYADKAQWENFCSVGMVRSRVECNGEISMDTRYFIFSLLDIQTFSKAVRKHWGIENSLHWCLDMTFHEDYSRIRKDHSAENMAVARHIALNILKNHPSKSVLPENAAAAPTTMHFLLTLFAPFMRKP